MYNTSDNIVMTILNNTYYAFISHGTKPDTDYYFSVTHKGNIIIEVQL